MRWHGWPRVKLRIPAPCSGAGEEQDLPAQEVPSNREVEAIAPLIISASRSTDIPAFYGDWFMERVRKGYAKWVNPWNGAPMYVSFQNVRVFVFWSKNPEPFLPSLAEMTRCGYQCCVLFTLNDYEAEGVEPRLPPLKTGSRTFPAVSRMIGKGRVAWRWDPLLLSDSLDVAGLLNRIWNVGDAIAPFTERMVFSFIDIARYPGLPGTSGTGGSAISGNFRRPRNWNSPQGFRSSTGPGTSRYPPAERKRTFPGFGMEAAGCISRDLMLREFEADLALCKFLEAPDPHTSLVTGATSPVPPHLKDPGQRPYAGASSRRILGSIRPAPISAPTVMPIPPPKGWRNGTPPTGYRLKRVSLGIQSPNKWGDSKSPGQRPEDSGGVLIGERSQGV